jgi:hypothetical protein
VTSRTLPTSNQFLWYELVQLGVVSNEKKEPKPGCKTVRRPGQTVIDALTHLRDVELVPWDEIEGETRTLEEFATAPTVAEYVLDSVNHASLDRWAGKPAPLILCESRSLAGALRNLAATYACPIAASNGQAKGFLITKIAPRLHPDQRVLYLGDSDHSGYIIEDHNRRTLAEHTGVHERLWERVALTTEQVDAYGLRPLVIRKRDERYKNPPRYFDAVETEAFGQARIVAALRDRLDELIPEPLDDVLEREQRQRAQVAEQLRRLREDM